MLVDTGADLTLVPKVVVDALQLAPTEGRVELGDYDGSPAEAPIVRLVLLFAGRTYRGEYVSIDANWRILGRNVLNTLVLHLG